MHPSEWLKVRPEGLYCAPGNFYIDPVRSVENAVITHGHSDHARSGHKHVYATPESAEIIKTRYGQECCQEMHAIDYSQRFQLGEVNLFMEPAGHILGSAQVAMEYGGNRVVITGDYKRRRDPTCKAFKPIKCDIFITEATFALPVFKHPPTEDEIKKLLKSLKLFPDRCHAVGVYALGKCQRLIMELREAGYDKPIYIHGALVKLCDLYRKLGVKLGELIQVAEVKDKELLRGQIVLCPPSAIDDRWSRKLPDVLTCAASGWMQIRARAKQKLVELPLIISDHCDWDELLQTVDELKPKEVWVTHGREEALIYAIEKRGIKARALSLIGYEDDDFE